MSLSIFIWLVISAFLLGFWFWTMYILYRQKQAWKAYADKRKLRFYANRFYDGPTISGAIDEYKVTIFTSEHSELDASSQRRLTAIEVNLHTCLSVPGAIASGGMVPVVEGLDIHKEYRPNVKGWDDSYIVRSRDVEYMQEYLDTERINKILELMKIEKAWVVLLFSSDQGLLRFDTPLAMDNPKKLDRLIKKLIEVSRALELKKGEEAQLLRKRSKASDKQKILNIDEDLLEDDIGFELEEE